MVRGIKVYVNGEDDETEEFGVYLKGWLCDTYPGARIKIISGDGEDEVIADHAYEHDEVMEYIDELCSNYFELKQ